jgi:penicillin-binding protein 1A
MARKPSRWARTPRATDGRVAWTALAARVALCVVLLAGLAVLALAALVMSVVPSAPGMAQLRELQAARPSVLLSADGKLLMKFARAQHEPVPLAKISRHIVDALLATEDQRFYDHHGVDIHRTLGAVFQTLAGDTQGGSTITQQLARNLFPDEIGRSRTLTRKIREAVTALRIERAWSKDRILATYLNSAPFLYNVVGIEMAARTYYDKPAAELDVLESATLIGMLKGTSYYNPVSHPERSLARRNVVLAQLVKTGRLSPARFEALRAQPLTVQLHRPPDALGVAPHFAVQLRKWLVGWADEHGLDLYADGLVVHATLDSRLQAMAAQAVDVQTRALQAVADVEWRAAAMPVRSHSPQAYERYLKTHPRGAPFAHFWATHGALLAQALHDTPEYEAALKAGRSDAEATKMLRADPAVVARVEQARTRLEAGFVAMDPATGAVRAWVGSRDFDLDQYDHVSLARRQPGSTFKPFVYGAALQNGLSPERSYLDGPVEIALPDGKIWRPTDMGGASGLPMTLRDGLVHSKNTITAQVAQEVGLPAVVTLARAMGVDESPLDPVPSLALGTSPVTLLEMVSAYSTLAQQGMHHAPVMVSRITDRHGALLAEFDGGAARRALSNHAALDLIDMLRGVIERGTGTQIRSRFGIQGDVAGKTGTTQNNTDGWFILMHPDLVAGAWVGFNDSRVTLRSDYWGQGGHNAVLLVGDFFRSAQKAGFVDRQARFPPPPHPRVETPVPETVEPPAWNTPAIDPAEQQRQDDQIGAADPHRAPDPPDELAALQYDDFGLVVGGKAGLATSRAAGDAPPR